MSKQSARVGFVCPCVEGFREQQEKIVLAHRSHGLERNLGTGHLRSSLFYALGKGHGLTRNGQWAASSPRDRHYPEISKSNNLLWIM